jgi:hypothetical protein
MIITKETKHFNQCYTDVFQQGFITHLSKYDKLLPIK